MKKVILATIAMAFLTLGSGFAQTQDLGKKQDKQEKDFSRWQVRVRGVWVNPKDQAKIETIGGDIDVSTNFIPELDFTYFFTKNIAAELILGTSGHSVHAKNTAVGDLDLGSVYLLPPTLNLQYHFYPWEGVKPYVGIGANYTIFYNTKSGDANGISYDNEFGYGFQLGFDIDITDKFFVNVDFKKLFLDTDVVVDASNLNGGAALDIPAKVTLDPMMLSFGVGMRF